MLHRGDALVLTTHDKRKLTAFARYGSLVVATSFALRDDLRRIASWPRVGGVSLETICMAAPAWRRVYHRQRASLYTWRRATAGASRSTGRDDHESEPATAQELFDL